MLFVLALPFFFRTVGMKGVLFIGMAAWAVRYVIFANGFTDAGAVGPPIYIGLALHGVGFDLRVRRRDDLDPQEFRGGPPQPRAVIPGADTWGSGLSDLAATSPILFRQAEVAVRSTGTPSGCSRRVSPRSRLRSS